MTPLRSLLLAGILLAAGCVGDPVEPARATPPTPEPNPGVEPDVAAESGPALNATWSNGSIAGAGEPGAGYFRAAGDNVLAFTLPEGATGLLVEVAWEGGDALDVQADVPESYCSPIDPAGLFLDCPSPDPDAEGLSPARIEVTDAESLARVGEWSLGVWARRSANEVPFTVVVTIVRNGTLPAGYSALGGV